MMASYDDPFHGAGVRWQPTAPQRRHQQHHEHRKQHSGSGEAGSACGRLLFTGGRSTAAHTSWHCSPRRWSSLARRAVGSRRRDPSLGACTSLGTRQRREIEMYLAGDRCPVKPPTGIPRQLLVVGGRPAGRYGKTGDTGVISARVGLGCSLRLASTNWPRNGN